MSMDTADSLRERRYVGLDFFDDGITAGTVGGITSVATSEQSTPYDNPNTGGTDLNDAIVEMAAHALTLLTPLFAIFRNREAPVLCKSI